MDRYDILMEKLDKVLEYIHETRTSIKVNYTILFVLGLTTLIFMFYGGQLGQDIHVAGSSILLGFISGMWIFHLVGVSLSTVEKREDKPIRVPERINYSIITICVTCSLLLSVRVSFTGKMAQIMTGFTIMIAVLTLFFGITLSYLGYFVDNQDPKN